MDEQNNPKDLITLTEEAFAPNGPLAQALAERGRDYIVNEQQIQYAILVAKALSGEEYKASLGAGEREAFGDNPVLGITALLEAETGVGKTLGYLVPLCLHLALTSRRGLVSTHTLNLQRQILHREFEAAAAVAKHLTDVKLTVALQKGRRNFVSVRRVRELQDALREENQLDPETDKVLNSLADHPDGDIAKWLESNEMPAEIKQGDICLLPGMSDQESAHYLEHRIAAESADVLVVTHALLLISCKNWHGLFGNPPFDAAIIDEADQIPFAAESVFANRVSIPMLSKLGEILKGYNSDSLSRVVKEWHEWMDNLYETFTKKNAPNFHREGNGGYIILGDERDKAITEQAQVFAVRIKNAIDQAVEKAKDQRMRSEDVSELKTFSNDMNDFWSACNDLMSSWTSPVIRWSPVKQYGAFSVVPLWPGQLVSRLWRDLTPKGEDGKRDITRLRLPYLRSVIMTSATLDAPGQGGTRFFGFRQQIGLFARNSTGDRLDHYNEIGSASLAPPKFGKMSIMLADRRVPKPPLVIDKSPDSHVVTEDGESEAPNLGSHPKWIKYAARGIAMAQARGGRSLVLLPSYRDTALIAEEARNCGVSLIEHKPGEHVSDHLSAFRAPDNPNGVFITPAAWHGVDLPGVLRHVIIPRVPFVMMESARNKALLRRLMLNAQRRSGKNKNRRNDEETQNERKMTAAQALSALYAFNLASARSKLRQGIGRGIRSVNDSITLWILDPRFPLPSTITGDRKRRQINFLVPQYMVLAACIPDRFRFGMMSAYDRAEIFLAEPDVIGDD